MQRLDAILEDQRLPAGAQFGGQSLQDLCARGWRVSTYPLEHQVGIDAMLQSNAGHGCTGLLNQFQELAFEGRAMPALCGDDGR